MRFYHSSLEDIKAMSMAEFYNLTIQVVKITEMENPVDEKDKPQPLTSKHFAQFVKDKKAKR